MPAILFVCTANICRSPLAVAIFQKIISERPDAADWRIESAGTWGMDGESAAEGSIRVIEERGGDLRSHRARTVTRQLIKQFDLILTMEAGHKEALRHEYPEARSRIYQVSEMKGHRYDISDPIGQPLESFRVTARNLDRLLGSCVSEIEQYARTHHE